MKRPGKGNIKITCYIIFLAMLFLLTGILLYSRTRILNSDSVRSLIRERVQKSYGIPVSMGGAQLHFFKEPHFIFTDIRIGTPDSQFLKAEQMTVRFSLWRLLLGRLHIRHIQLSSPEAIVSIDSLGRLGHKDQKVSLPVIVMENGSGEISLGGHVLTLACFNGKINDKMVRIETEVLGAKTTLLARQVDKKWVGGIKMSDVNLSRLSPGIRGRADIEVNIQQEDQNGIKLAAQAESKQVILPGGGKTLKNVVFNIRAVSRQDHLKIEEIKIKTPVADVFGRGRIQWAGGWGQAADALLQLDLESSTIDYEAAVSHLPVEFFPDWLSMLLNTQIREGKVRLSDIKYNGTFADFKDPELFLNNLYLKGDLWGQSFGAGYGLERVRVSTAKLIVSSSDLIVRDIAGYAGASKILAVDLIFSDLLRPGSGVIVNVDVDMAACDLVDTWRAAMVPKTGYDLFAPISGVESGQVKGQVTFRQNKEEGARIMGSVWLSECDFLWNGHQVKRLEGHATASGFDAPARINLSGELNTLPIENLALTLDDPLGEQVARFSVKAGGLPEITGFQLHEGATLILEGTGKGPDIQGTGRMSADGFTLFGTDYEADKEKIYGEGRFTGTLWPEAAFDFSGVTIPLPPGNLELEYRTTGHGGGLNLKGDIHLNQPGETPGQASRPVRGGIDMVLIWDENNTVAGHVMCDSVSLFYKDTPWVIDGPLMIFGDRITFTRLNLKTGDSTILTSGFLSLGETRKFNGSADITGLNISRQSSPESLDLPASLSAAVLVTLTDLTLLGVPFEHGAVHVDLSEGRMTLDQIDLRGRAGTLSGKLTFDPEQKDYFDLHLDLRDKGSGKLLSTLYPDKLLIEGEMRLNGHVWGTGDAIEGRLDFSAKDGYTQQFTPLSNLFTALNLYKILKTGDIQFDKDRFKFNTITSTFNINNSLVTFDDFYLDSPSYQFSAVGEVAINTKQINALVGVHPLETIDKAVSIIPLVGWVLTGDQGWLIVLSFRVSGNIDDPLIEVAEGDDVSGFGAATLLRLLKLPGTLIGSPELVIPGLEE